MLDVNQLTQNLEQFRTRLETRNPGELPLDEVHALNDQRKSLQKEYDDLVHAQRELGPKIGAAKKAKEDASALMAESTALKAKIKDAEASKKEVDAQVRELMLKIPNLPHPETPVGGEADGVVRETVGQPVTFDFEPKDHVAICDATGLVEFGDKAVRLAGSSFVLYRGQGARLARALINFFLDLHTTEHGYTEVSPPFVANRTTLTGTGQLPKFEDDQYLIPGENREQDLFLIPTAEVPLTNIHQNEILPEGRLPFGYCAYTPCFRREAGSAGKMTRGLKRLHQFDKVELVRFCKPEESDEQHQLLLKHAREPLERLGLHYRVLELASGDIGYSAARCYDLEAHSPGTGEWLEVSSCSTFTDYQARRARIRCKGKKGADGKKPKTREVHTLNASGLALPRVIIAILETYQQQDGTVRVPEVLVPYMGGRELLDQKAGDLL